jgi:hypothetical protein
MRQGSFQLVTAPADEQGDGDEFHVGMYAPLTEADIEMSADVQAAAAGSASAEKDSNLLHKASAAVVAQPASLAALGKLDHNSASGVADPDQSAQSQADAGGSEDADGSTIGESYCR